MTILSCIALLVCVVFVCTKNLTMITHAYEETFMCFLHRLAALREPNCHGLIHVCMYPCHYRQAFALCQRAVAYQNMCHNQKAITRD